ncbi:LTA synthase family protein [Ohtaekwangia koreensis]|uniref:Phosphoglycerol transferase MdoB n=1 Tax=Ohtaekwangia koreensis TaxID=688867 RepID=A0A1T5M8F5_9BACT|nr:alkaline phosphatase family protein [Ohtaekwangia koreensis]SKC84129.1 Phosphoglycerol transferase MdoB [Ohtaekwangia koreensis]
MSTKKSIAAFLQRFTKSRFSNLLLLIGLLVSISMITRVVFLIQSIQGVDITILNIAGIFILGLFYDLINASYFIIPLLFYIWITPQRIYSKAWSKYILYGFFSLLTFILLFNAVAEWFFWDEFGARYNFIAVDYLVYTNEVLGNIKESYPVAWIVAGVITLCLLLQYALRNRIRTTDTLPMSLKKRSSIALVFILLPITFFFTVTNRGHHFSSNAYVNELAANGMYELFAAYRNNELNYEQFYKKIPNEESFIEVKKLIHTAESQYISNEKHDLTRKVTHSGKEKRLNVVLISVESLSADFMSTFGSTKGITPFLDSLATQSLLFTKVYATGTRTVRGLEALSLCVPPTPGQSIVRRPHNEHMSSLGKIFEQKGYESKFIYGGYGYFDNMGYFFANNSYSVVDRNELKDEEIDYENIWGVADENLFTLTQHEIEKTIAAGKPVFAHVMTTSNHRPYTYPEGRINIPSHTCREGAVKYTDYAIGKFIKSCSHKSWFANTVFVIIADHCASSAGKSELPIQKYHIPLLIYSPSNIPASHMDRLMSQIDLGPTLLGLLNFSYTSKFYGYDIFALEPGRERIFISTYQSLGYVRDNKLIVLSPQQKEQTFLVNFKTNSLSPIANDSKLTREAISWYQSASYAFRKGLMH